MANGKQLSQKGAEEILDIIDSYIDVKEAVTQKKCCNCLDKDTCAAFLPLGICSLDKE